ncbi:ABC transporter permease [Pikeienuella piscinae]|uniref:ABC transporter permease n=1 Tax=Pikeienuella piscinae TaxID=2748098 RepID=A0A7L5BV95_9RHOB|nr:ABC transporter permease [Pikeienuella piscinae]QIE54993.1 ABC transporter permease [Pikeienuella piscinae]
MSLALAEGARRHLARHSIFLVLAVIFIVAALSSPAFTDPAYLLNVLRQAAPVGIAAVGVTLVMILGGVDLSVGAVISLTAVLAAAVMAGEAANLPLAIAAASAAGLAIGALNGALIAFTRVSPFILTLGMGVAIAGLTQMYTGGTAKGVVSPGYREFFNFRLGGIAPVLALAFLALAAFGVLVQKTTVFGRRLYLVGANPEAAMLSGLPVRSVTVVAYSLAGLFGALAGLALLARSGVSSTVAGQGLEFQVLAAVVLGGTTFEGGRGGVAGTVAGVLVLSIAFNLVNIAGLPYHMQLTVMGAIIIAASALYGQMERRSD